MDTRTHRAWIWFLAGVEPLVRCNVALVGETPWAHGACVGLLARVGPLVLGCLALAAELLGAERVIEGYFLAWIRYPVLRQLAGALEPLLAVTAFRTIAPGVEGCAGLLPRGTGAVCGFVCLMPRRQVRGT